MSIPIVSKKTATAGEGTDPLAVTAGDQVVISPRAEVGFVGTVALQRRFSQNKTSWRTIRTYVDEAGLLEDDYTVPTAMELRLQLITQTTVGVTLEMRKGSPISR